MNKSKHADEFIYPVVSAGHLQIDDDGKIWRVSRTSGGTGGFLRISQCTRHRADFMRQGYLSIRVKRDGVEHSTGAHRLVYRHFFGPIPDDLTINHKNGNKTDNRPSNLELATHSQQRIHALRCLGALAVVPSGMNCNFSKATPNEVMEIRERRRQGEKLSSLAESFKFSESGISAICNYKSWKRI